MLKVTLLFILTTFSAAASAQITSTFDADADGWTVLNGVVGDPVYVSTGGNPGGFLQGSDGVGGVPTLMVAPAKFLGNRIFSYGELLRFDLKVALAPTSSGAGDMRIYGGGSSLFRNVIAPIPNTTTWTSYSLQLHEDQIWRVGSITGPIATEEQVKRVLTSVTAIHISVEYNATIQSPSDMGYLDNVILEQRILLPAPIITSFTPASGIPGTTVTINGNNFDPTSTNNAIYFGSVSATVSNATANQLTVTLPSGSVFGEITVVNNNTGLSTQSLTPFNPTFEGGGRIIPASFNSRFDILLDATVGNDLNGLAVADLDGDGWSDLLVTETSLNSVSIFRNLGSGGTLSAASFAPKFLLTNTTSLSNGGLHTIDLDGDGKLDVIAAYDGGAFASFATNRNTSTPGNLSFEPVELWATPVAGNTLVSEVVDVDGDGRPDLIGQASTGSVGADFWIAQNISTPGNIEFGASIAYFGGTTLDAGSGVSTGDLDNDGIPEIIVKHNFGGQFQIIKNNSTPGVISLGAPFPIARSSYGEIVIADFNLDGKNDIALKHGFSNDDVHIRINTNSGGALAATDFATEVILDSELSFNGGISVADVNGDGKPDIIATDAGDFGVFENKYAGGVFDANAFASAHQLEGSVNVYPTDPIVADLNGDQKPEIILGFTNSSPVRISIYENKNVHAPVVSLNTVSPLKGSIGSTVTITGNNFSTIPSENKVWFGGVEANVLSSTATEITAEVPAGAGYERVSVVRNNLTSYYHLPFNVTFSPGVTFDGTSFLPPVTLPLTTADYDVEVADLNNDGKPDIVAESDVSVFNGLAYRNVHTIGAITSASFILDDTTSTSAQDLKLMDVDADGKHDILSSGGMYKNSSTSTEINFEAVAGLNNIRFGSWADFNADGMIDVVSITNGTANVSVYENRYRGSGAFLTGAFSTFSAASTLAKSAINGSVISADFDNDGLADLVSTNPGTDNLSIWRNTSAYRIVTSQFTSVGNINAGDVPGRLYSGDLDLDGKMDLMLYHSAGTNSTLISVFHNQSTTGNIVFNKVDFTIPAAATVAHLRDLDGDGKPEILVTSESTDQFFILKNTSTQGTIDASSFATPFATPVTNPRGITTGDLNLDGKPEIIIASAPNSLLIFENVIPSVSISITTQPAALAVCDGVITSFTTAAIGTTNITYQWQFSSTLAGTYTDINNGGGYNNVNTASLSVNTTGNFGAGFYRCRISGDLAATVFSNAVELTINVIPAAPTITNGDRCGAGSVTLVASGGVDGQYRWYTTATGGTVIAGEVDGIYVTPSLTTTTPYFVSINNGCESLRTPVTATVNTPPTIPTITSSITLTSNAVTICSTTALTLSAPNGFASYSWSNGATTSQINVSTSGSYTVIVTNGAGCSSPASDVITVTVVPAPCTNSAPVINNTTLITTLGNTVSIDLSTLISDADNNLVLSTLTILQQPTSGAQASLNGTTLQINYSGNSFTGIDVITIRVCDVFGECTTQQLQINVIGEIEIFNGVSHNNDGKNDFFKIQNIESLEPDNAVTIYNRWGSKVFETENYSEVNAFRGLNQNGNELPSGTYFYKIFLKSSGKTETGYLVLKR